MEISKVIPRIRFKLADTSEVKYSDFEIYQALNEANSYFRKICVDRAPDLIARENEGQLMAGENVLFVSNNPIKVTEVRINGRKIHPATMNQIDDTNAEGYPELYVPKFIGGNVKLFVYPKANHDVNYSVQFIDEIEDIDSDTDLEYPREIITAFEDFVVSRLSQEDASALDALGEKVKDIVNGIVPDSCVVRPYY